MAKFREVKVLILILFSLLSLITYKTGMCDRDWDEVNEKYGKWKNAVGTCSSGATEEDCANNNADFTKGLPSAQFYCTSGKTAERYCEENIRKYGDSELVRNHGTDARMYCENIYCRYTKFKLYCLHKHKKGDEGWDAEGEAACDRIIKAEQSNAPVEKSSAERAQEAAAKKAAAEAQEKIAALKKKNDKCRKPKFFVCTSADETMSVCCGQDQGCKNIGNSLVSCFGGDGISDHFSPSEQTGKNQPEAVYEENKDAIRRKEELDKQEEDSLARADAARLKQEKALALAVEEQRKKEEQNRKEAAQREEQAKQEQARQEAAEKQRIQDDLAALQNLPSVPPGSSTQAPSAVSTQPSPVQQVMGNETEDSCGIRCLRDKARNAVKAAGKGALTSAMNFLSSEPPHAARRDCPPGPDFQDCAVNLVATRSWFFGMTGGLLHGVSDSTVIIDDQVKEGMGESK